MAEHLTTNETTTPGEATPAAIGRTGYTAKEVAGVVLVAIACLIIGYLAK